MEVLEKELINKSKKWDEKISIAVLSPMLILIIQLFLLNYFNLIGTTVGNIIQIISKLLVGIAFVSAAPVLIRRSLVPTLITYLIAIIIFLLNYLFFEQNRVYLNQHIFDMFFISVPIFLFMISLINIETFWVKMEKIFKVIFIVGLIFFSFIALGYMTLPHYSMSFSYYMLPPTIIYIYKYTMTKGRNYLICSLMGIVMILGVGSRGPLMCIAFYLFLNVGINTKSIKLKSVIRYTLTLIIFIIIIIYLENIFLLLEIIFSKINIDSRTLSMLLERGLNLSGRDKIYGDIIFQIKENPWFGIGIVGDRYFLNGQYSHNIFIELLSGFGIVLGLILIIVLISLMIYSVFQENKNFANLLAIWISLGFIPLIVSGSYISEIKFWILLGLLIRGIKKLNYNHR